MLAIGRNPVTEALRSSHNVRKIYLQEGINESSKINEVLELAQQKQITVENWSRKKLDKKATGEPHQGVIAEVGYSTPSITKADIIENSGLYFYVREAQYEHNLGAIIRTAEVAAIAGVIIPPKQEVTPVTVRVSMGGVFHIPIYQGSLFPTIKQFSKAQYTVAGLERGGENLLEAEMPENTLLIVGGEDKELSPQVIDKCDQLVSIPQYGKVNSLNMSVASAIAIYNYRRQHPI